MQILSKQQDSVLNQPEIANLAAASPPYDSIDATTTEITEERLGEKFSRLAAEWKSRRGPHSSSAKLAMHPAYQKIIGMGSAVVPLILQELKTNLDSWFWALSSITGEDPVREEDQGNGKAMANAWI